MKKSLVFVSALLLLTGCFEQPGVAKLKNIKKEKVLNTITYSKKYSKSNFRAEIDKNDDYIDHVCVGICMDKISKTDSIYFGKKGYSCNIPIHKSYYCGYGSLIGWPCLLTGGYIDYSKKNAKVCDSKFTSVNGYALGIKLGIGLITFMTPLITGMGVYTKSFDEHKFKTAIYNSGLYIFKNDLIREVEKYGIKNGIFDVLYVNKYLNDTLHQKYNKLLFTSYKRAGDVFIARKTGAYSIIVFKRYDNEFVSRISSEINDIIKDFSKSSGINYSDIKSLIPPKIKKPEFPPVEKFEKSEFETKKEFKKRVQKALAKRDEEIKKIKEKYYLAVYKRNLYIESLKKAYEEYLKQESQANKTYINIIKQNIPELSKYLAVEQFNFHAGNFEYNAENERLYFKLFSVYGINENAYIMVSPNIAKSIKLQRQYKVVPDFVFENNMLKLQGFKLLAYKNKRFYPVHFTDKMFKPLKMSAKIITSDERIAKIVQKEFKKFRQKPVVLKDNVNVMLVQNINYNSIHRVPKWFVNPPENLMIGFGSGKTYEQAISNARAELAKMLEIKIQVNYYSDRKFKNFRTFKEIEQSTKQTSDVKLTNNDYKIYKQTKLDGIWYVGLEYTGKEK